MQVDHPAVGRGHGFQSYATAGLKDTLGDAVSHFAEGILAALTILLDVQRNADLLIEPLADDTLNDELERVQGVAATPNQQPGIGAVDVDHRATCQLVVLGAECYVNFSADSSEDALDSLYSGSGGRVRVYGRDRRGTAGRLPLINGFRLIEWRRVQIEFVTFIRFRWSSATYTGDADLGQFTAYS